MKSLKIKKLQLTTSQIIILGFAAAILIGALLLTLPISTADRKGASFPDALFTATSAICVTGLVVRDTATYWSLFGQGVILAMIQIGGMGVVTLAVAITMISGRKISLKTRSTMQEAISAHHIGGVVHLTGFIIRGAGIIELTGALLLMPAFIPRFGVVKGIWYSFWHSISAFCNAGFDLMGIRGEYSSLTSEAFDPLINVVIMLLIAVGGIGFLTWEDIVTNKWRFKKYRMQSKIILVTSALLTFIPAAIFFFTEFSELPAGQRIWAALFQSVTARTAGFNTVDLNLLTGSGLTVMIFLMLVGGSPGSTAGGMKTTTLATMLSTSLSVFKSREHTNFFGRRISDEPIRQAGSILTMYLTLFLSGGCIISRIEGLPLRECLFETASAIGTVGVTLGITPQLGGISRMILILLMYFGRVGGLTIIFAALSNKKSSPATLPEEKLTVG